MKKDLRDLLDAAKARGWSVSRTGGDHLRLRHPAGATVYVGSTPSCRRGLLNFEADLRRAERTSMQEAAL